MLFARRIVETPLFQRVVLAAILITSVLVGLATSTTLIERYGAAFALADSIVQAFFVAEIALRLLAFWPRLGRFFLDGCNVFDFAVVAASLLPQAGVFAMAARLARLLRVARLISLFPELRLIVTTMLRSIPSMGHVLVMLSLLLYVYGVFGVHLFRDDDPARWGTLGTTLLTLFQLLTLEGWVDVQAEVLVEHPWAWAYFASFVFIAVFVVVNLFIAAVINNLESAKLEEQLEEDRRSPHVALLQAIEDAKGRLDHLENVLRELPLERLATEPTAKRSVG